MRPGDNGVIPVVLCLDVEPAGRARIEDGPGPWPGLVATHEWLDDRRAGIEAATGRPAHVSWFLRMDPQIEAVFGSAGQALQAHAERFDDARDRGDQLGLHVHAFRPSGTPGEWTDAFDDPAWVDRCIDDSFEAFDRHVGEPCRVTRMGFRFWSDTVRDRLRAHGTVVDLTREPGRPPVPAGEVRHVSGGLPDHRAVPRRPYGRAPVELPLSATRRLVGPGVRARAWRLRSGRFRRLDQPFTLRHEATEPDSFTGRLERCLDGQRHPYLAFALQTGDLGPDLRARVDRHLDLLLAHPVAPRLAFTTPEEAVSLVRGG